MSCRWLPLYGQQSFRSNPKDLRARCNIFVENLDRDIPIQPRIAGAIHVAHTASAKRGPDLSCVIKSSLP